MIVKHEAGADNAVNKQVYDVLRRNLMIGHFKPGQPISIRYLTETLGVSATPAREAIKRLQAEYTLVIGSNRTPVCSCVNTRGFERFTRHSFGP